MACNIRELNGEVSVLTDQGQPSLLFQDLKNNFTEDQALGLYKASRSTAFQTIEKSRNALLYSVNNTDVKLSKQIKGNSISYIPTIGNRRIGTFRVKTNSVDGVTIYDAFKGKGYGKMLYKQVAKDLAQSGIQLQSDASSSQDAINVWESLVSEGLAEVLPNGRYQFILQNTYSNGEPSMQSVLEFVQNQNRTQRELNTEEKIELKNISLGYQGDLKAEMQKVFYDPEGFFTFVPSKMISLYSAYEIDRILKSPTLQNQIKESVEAFQNTEYEIINEYSFPQEQLEKSDVIGQFGKAMYLNPNVQKQDLLEEIAGIEESLYTFSPLVSLTEAQSFVKATVLTDVDGTITAPNLGDRLAISVLTENNTKAVDTIIKITGLSEQTLLENPQETYKVLNRLENEALKIGIDVIGIKDQADNPALKPLLNTLGGVMYEPTQENVALFSSIYEEMFPSNLQLTKAIRQTNDRDYIYLETALSEGQVFEQIGAIKKLQNTYVYVNDKALEELYTIAQAYSPNLTELENQRQALKIESPSREIAEKINLFKTILGFDGLNEGLSDGIKDGVFTGSYKYLTNDFIADFNIKMLREKKKNSPMWLNFYSNFEINENGIKLKYTDDLTLSNVNELADENLRQYSLISRQMPQLDQNTIDENPDISQRERDYYINNPQEAPLMENPTIVDSTTLISDNQERFVKRSDGSLWENVMMQNGKSLYKRQMVNKTQFNTFNNPKPRFNSFDINLGGSQTDTTNVKDSRKAKNIMQESFDC